MLRDRDARLPRVSALGLSERRRTLQDGLDEAGEACLEVVLAYGALSVPAVLAGVIANGSGLEPTFRAFAVAVAVAVAALALTTALASQRVRRLPLAQPVGG